MSSSVVASAVSPGVDKRREDALIEYARLFREHTSKEASLKERTF